MTGQIIEAICKELQALFEETGTTVLRDTNFKPEDMPLYTMPCVVVEIASSNEFFQYSGGATSGDWDININSFFYDFNANLGNDSGYSTDAYNIIETLIEHFAMQTFLSAEMIAAVASYSLKLTLNGTIRDNELQHNGGVIPGYSITYNTVAVNTNTAWVESKTYTSQTSTGGVVYDFDLSSVIWRQPVISRITNAAFLALTPVVIGQRYYITDLGVIKTVLTVAPITFKVATFTSETVILNWIFFSNADDLFMYWHDGTALNEIEVETETIP